MKFSYFLCLSEKDQNTSIIVKCISLLSVHCFPLTFVFSLFTFHLHFKSQHQHQVQQKQSNRPHGNQEHLIKSLHFQVQLSRDENNIVQLDILWSSFSHSTKRLFICSLPGSALARFSWLQVKETQLKLSSAREKEFIGSRTWEAQEFTWLPALMSPSVCLLPPLSLLSFSPSPTSHLPLLQPGPLLTASKRGSRSRKQTSQQLSNPGKRLSVAHPS